MKRSLPHPNLTIVLLAGVLAGAPVYATAATPSQVIGASDVIGRAFWWVSWLNDHEEVSLHGIV